LLFFPTLAMQVLRFGPFILSAYILAVHFIFYN
jgi:hypothetical protein